MLNFIDHFLNRITMYRLTLYYLALLFLIAVIFGSLGILPYSPLALLISILIILLTCWITNAIFARIFNAPTNVESMYITALILALIITPPSSADYFSNFSFLIWASVWAMASKYIFAIRKKHIFNPAAFAVALMALTINQSASWWISSLYMMPFVVAGGLLVARKIKRFDLVVSFLIVAILSILGFSLLRGSDFITTVQKTLLYSPLLFFAFVMITEPLTAPPSKLSRIFYGALVGFLFAPAIHIGSIYSTPELALLVGNFFAFLISPKGRYILKLKEKIRVAPDIYDFLFSADRKLAFQPGQYLEWTLPHKHPDNRGNRRYFTIASSPTEEELRLGVKFYSDSSSFKKMLMSMGIGSEIVASQPAGDFVLPKDKKQKLVFIAGGIGITPFRSIMQYLIDQNEKRPIILFYSNLAASDIVYEDILNQANEQLGIKTIYTLTDSKLIPDSWRGQKGFINEQMIINEVPDYKERLFYISGPPSMVVGLEKILRNIGVVKKQIRTDFFPGFDTTKKSATTSFFIFWAVAIVILAASLVFYSRAKLFGVETNQNEKEATPPPSVSKQQSQEKIQSSPMNLLRDKLLKAFPNARIIDIKSKKEPGIYDATLIFEGRNYKVKIDSSGNILKTEIKEAEVEEGDD